MNHYYYRRHHHRHYDPGGFDGGDPSMNPCGTPPPPLQLNHEYFRHEHSPLDDLLTTWSSACPSFASFCSKLRLSWFVTDYDDDDDGCC